MKEVRGVESREAARARGLGCVRVRVSWGFGGGRLRLFGWVRMRLASVRECGGVVDLTSEGR